MHPYLSYLLADLKNAEQKEDENEEQKRSVSCKEEMEEVERYVSGDSEQPLNYFTELTKGHFPPAEQLDEIEMEQVLTAVQRLLFTWHVNISFSEKRPFWSATNLC